MRVGRIEFGPPSVGKTQRVSLPKDKVIVVDTEKSYPTAWAYEQACKVIERSHRVLDVIGQEKVGSLDERIEALVEAYDKRGEELAEAREELEAATKLIVEQYNTLRGIGSKLGWLLFNLGKGKTDAARNLAIGALEYVDKATGHDFAEGWKPCKHEFTDNLPNHEVRCSKCGLVVGGCTFCIGLDPV